MNTNMAYQIGAVPMTFGDHSPIANIFVQKQLIRFQLV